MPLTNKARAALMCSLRDLPIHPPVERSPHEFLSICIWLQSLFPHHTKMQFDNGCSAMNYPVIFYGSAAYIDDRSVNVDGLWMDL